MKEPINVNIKIGIASMKENLVEVLLLTPKRIAIAIVIPDLEIPGRIAKHCANPINNASL